MTLVRFPPTLRLAARPLRLSVTRWSHLYKARNQTSSKRRCRHNKSLDASGDCASLNLYSADAPPRQLFR